MAENQFEEASDGQRYNTNREKAPGVKYTYRGANTELVVITLLAQGRLFKCLSVGCSHQIIAFKEFYEFFYDIVSFTSLFTNDEELIERIEAAFNEGRETGIKVQGTENAFRARAWNLIDLWKEYLVELKDAGIFNPELENYEENKGNVFRDSIG